MSALISLNPSFYASTSSCPPHRLFRHKALSLNPCPPPLYSSTHHRPFHLLRMIRLSRYFSSTFRQNSSRNPKMNMTAYSSAMPGPPLPSDPSSGSWKLWIMGMLITAILPFWKNINLGPLLKFKQEVDTVVEEAEQVADIVEKVAEGVEKVVEEVAEHLPEGGKLIKAANFVENVAREADKDARLAEQVFDKVEELEKEVESVIEPGIYRSNHHSMKESIDQKKIDDQDD